jgi:hypothetical protein
MLFTVTKITHTIEGKDWTTQLSTQARVTAIGEIESNENTSSDIRVGVSAPYKLQQLNTSLPTTPGSQLTTIPGLNPFNTPPITGPQRTSGAGSNLLPGESFNSNR